MSSVQPPPPSPQSLPGSIEQSSETNISQRRKLSPKRTPRKPPEEKAEEVAKKGLSLEKIEVEQNLSLTAEVIKDSGTKQEIKQEGISFKILVPPNLGEEEGMAVEESKQRKRKMKEELDLAGEEILEDVNVPNPDEAVQQDAVIAPQQQPEINPQIKRLKFIATTAASLGARLAFETFAFSKGSYPGLLGAKVLQLAYDYSQGNTTFLVSNAKQMAQSLALRYGSLNIYAALMVAQIGLDIFRKDWIGAADSLANIIPNDTLTIGAIATNPELRAQLSTFILENKTMRDQLFAHAAMNSPLFEFVNQTLVPHDEKLAKLVEEIKVSVQRYHQAKATQL